MGGGIAGDGLLSSMPRRTTEGGARASNKSQSTRGPTASYRRAWQGAACAVADKESGGTPYGDRLGQHLSRARATADTLGDPGIVEARAPPRHDLLCRRRTQPGALP